jgi:hypothetical protein
MVLEVNREKMDPQDLAVARVSKVPLDMLDKTDQTVQRYI